jgi:hypothetical protein
MQNQLAGLESIDPTANPIGQTGRALMPSIHNMSADQIRQQLTQAQQSGTPLNPRLAMMMIQLKQLEASKPPQSPPSTTVAQDIQNALQPQQAPQMPQSAPQGGLGGLSVPDDMYSTKGMAGGGIVAFAGAGPVDDYGYEMVKNAAGEWVRAADIASTTSGEFIGPEQRGWRSKVGTALRKNRGSLGSAAKTTGLRALASYPYAALGEGVIESGRTLSGNPIPIENIREYYADKGLPVDPDGSSLGADIGLRALTMGQKMATLGFFGPERDDPTAVETSTTGKKPSGPVDISEYMRRAEENVNGAGGSSAYGMSGMGNVDVSGPFAEARGELDTQRKAIGPTDANAESDAIAKAKAERIAAGIGAGTEKGLARNAESMAQLPIEKRRDAWLSAANAFFAMGDAGGRRGDFFGAASEGAMTGMKDYRNALDHIQERKDKLEERDLALQQQREALAQGDRTEGKGEIKDRQQQERQIDAEKRRLSVDEAKAKIDARMKEAELKVHIAVAQLARSGKEKAAIVLQRAWMDALAAKDYAAADAIAERATQWTTAENPAVIVQGMKDASAYGGPGGAPAAAPTGGPIGPSRRVPGT